MIEIVQAERHEDIDGSFYWSCWLEITQGPESWMLPTTALGALAENELQAYFDAREMILWQMAQAKQYAVDVFERVAIKRVLKAFALVVLDEVNILRVEAGLTERTADQLIAALKVKLRG